MRSHIKQLCHKVSESIKKKPADPSILAQVTIFAGLSQDELKLLQNICHLRLFNKDEVVYHDGEPAVAAFIIQSGSAGLYQLYGDETPERIACYYQGDHFGEMALITEGNRPYQAIALETTQLLVIFRTEFENLIAIHPHLGIIVLKNIAEKLNNRLIEKEEEMRTLAYKLVQAKIVV